MRAAVALAIITVARLANADSSTNPSSSGPAAKATKATARKTQSQKSKSQKLQKKPVKRESTAVSRDHKFKADNMPSGWSWPPTRAMVEQEKGCEAKLDDVGVTWSPGTPDGRIVDAVELPDRTLDGITLVGYSDAAPVMDCQLVLALAKFAPTLYGLGVREIHFGSIFRWTKVRAFGRTENMLSRHSIGIAMDVVSFVDDTGREAVVGRDYRRDDTLLLAVESAVNASGLFRILLTPKNDPRSHADHFHVEAAIDFSPPDELVAAKQQPPDP